MSTPMPYASKGPTERSLQENAIITENNGSEN